MIIAVTGHRPEKLGNDYAGTSVLSEKIYDELAAIVVRNKQKHGDKLRLITGMALGVDTLFAWVAIDLKVPFTAAVPFAGQERKWLEASQKVYRDIINNPLCTVKTVSLGTYSPEKMQIRNEWMVDQCDGLIAVWDGSAGGTWNCMKYAQIQKKPIVRINPNDLK